MGTRSNHMKSSRVSTRRRLLVERLGERRVLAAIAGMVFEDANHSLRLDDVESGAATRLVYLDLNDNGEFDVDESYSLADSDGSFLFPDLANGTYLVRLFSGTDSQTQTYPVEATLDASIEVSGANQLIVAGETAFALTHDSIVIGSLVSGNRHSLVVGDSLSSMQLLPNGTVLVIGSDASGDTAWVVNPNDATVSPVNLAGTPVPMELSNAAVDGSGTGVILDQVTGDVYAIDGAGPSVSATPTSVTIAPGSQVLTSNTGVLTVFALPDDGGMSLGLWSNQTNSFLAETPVFVSGLTGLLAYDGASGLLAARQQDGGVGVFDVNNHFAQLFAAQDIEGPIAIDGTRDLLMSISPGEAMLRIIDLRNGGMIADVAVDLATIGGVAAIAMGDRHDSVVVLGAAGITEIALNKPSAHVVVIESETDPNAILFGVAVDGDNSAPGYANQQSLAAVEDTLLELDAPGALSEAIDGDGDRFVLLQAGPANHGTASLGIDGSVVYQPNADFFGTDEVIVRLHDGRDVSEPWIVQIAVDGIADDPTDILIDIDPIPENIEIGTSIGTIEVLDVDGTIHIIEMDDPRFGHDLGQIIFIGGSGGIDYEQESTIPLTISATDPETQVTIQESLILTITDENDPVTAITPITGFVTENVKGDIVAELHVADQDAEQAHFLTVDDERFVVVDRVLRLAPGVEVDFETEPAIVINITAKEVPGGGTFTQPFTVTVRDEAEQPQVLNLTNKTVLGLDRGAIVGNITVDGQAPTSNFQFTVDDPRFEVDGTTLKLMDDQYVLRIQQDEVEIEITAVDTNGEFHSISETFVIEVLINHLPFHNAENPYDVDGQDGATALDALIIINYLGDYGPGPVGEGDPNYGYDVNGDGQVTALDALLIINQLNRLKTAVGNSDGEGEQAPIDQQRRFAKPKLDPSQIHSDQPLGVSEFDSRKIMDASSGKTSDAAHDPISMLAEQSSKHFAENVDATLRLLSDDDAEASNG